MVNKLLSDMSTDMKVFKYSNEPEESFIYRICYSALGLWGLKIGGNQIEKEIGTTKNNLTIQLGDLLQCYRTLFPSISNFILEDNKFISFIRLIYEETGYLITTENNHERIANYGRSISVGNECLFFGLPSSEYSMNGLGIFTNKINNNLNVNDFLIRDNISTDAFFKIYFNSIDFSKRDFDLENLEYFNPRLQKAPSESWTKSNNVDYTVARRKDINSYYRVMSGKNGLEFADFTDEGIEKPDKLTSKEYRRLYFSIKCYYNNPLRCHIFYLDNNYARIKLDGRLPNREYYYLLLISWPENTAYERTRFIIKRSFLPNVIQVLNNIGIIVKEN